MSKSDPIEQALNAISELRHLSDPEQLAQKLHSYLGNRSNFVVAKAAKLAAELHVAAAIPDLVAAFDRLFARPAKYDKGCTAMIAIVVALYQLDYLEPGVYLHGLHHVQKEASFGPPVDVAAPLRGICAQGLLRTRFSDAMSEVLPLLVDPESAARLGAVRALATNGGDVGLLLLRFKVLTGDSDPEILGDCFTALLAGAPELALRFVASYVDSEEKSTAEAAIWALGASRLQPAFEVLKEKWERTVEETLRQVLLSALAASRVPKAIEFLCVQLREGSLQTATDVLAALAPYATSESISKAVREAVEKRGQKSLLDLFTQQFAG